VYWHPRNLAAELDGFLGSELSSTASTLLCAASNLALRTPGFTRRVTESACFASPIHMRPYFGALCGECNNVSCHTTLRNEHTKKMTCKDGVSKDCEYGFRQDVYLFYKRESCGFKKLYRRLQLGSSNEGELRRVGGLENELRGYSRDANVLSYRQPSRAPNLHNLSSYVMTPFNSLTRAI
jgi:hypothetical protein